MSTPPRTAAQLLQSERFNYPGLLPREILVLKNWLRLHESEYDRFDYNVRIGSGFDPGPVQSESVRKMAIANTQKRVDAIGYKGSVVTLIEVKDRAGYSAMGQLIGYLHLWQHEHPDQAAPKMILVCNRTTSDFDVVAQRAGIQVDIVDVDYSQLQINQ